MRWLFLVLSVGLIAIALLAGAVAALAYGSGPAREGELEAEGVRQPVALTWDTDGSPTIQASNEPDLLFGLGYAHAADHAWAMTLWRQAGRGGLGAWFGPEVRALDRHARALGFEALAQQTYRTLDAETRALLGAYTSGVNAALSQPGVEQGDAFVLMDVEPDPWMPWDALVVERLMAYLSTPAPASDSLWARASQRDSTLRPFLTADSTFRATLGIGGTDGARAYVAPATDGVVFVAHQPAGASALDLFAPVTLQLDGQTIAAATIPGTLSFPIGWTGTGGWSVFLTSSMQLETFTGVGPPLVHNRIVERDGDEVLVSTPRDASGLVLGPATVSDTASPTDSTQSSWRLRWSGFRTATDVPAFMALIAGHSTPSFSLLRGDGMRVSSGNASALGTPPVILRPPADAVFAGAAPSSAPAAETLSWLLGRRDTLRLSAAALANADISLQAAQTLQPLLRALGDRDALDPVLDAPYAFLKGWNYRYTPDAIAPSLFESWLASHREYTGHAPDPSDSLDVQLLPFTLRIARASLRDAYGTEPTGWRWGRVQGGFFQPFGDRRGGQAFPMRFASPSVGAGGHPSALLPGPRIEDVSGTGAGPATWSAWAILGQPRLVVQTPLARVESAETDRLGPAIFTLAGAPSTERPPLTLTSPS